MGVKKGLEYVESELNNGTEAIFVTKDDKVYVTDPIKDTFKLSEDSHYTMGDRSELKIRSTNHDTKKSFLEVVEIRTKVASVFPFAVGVLFSIAFFHEIHWLNTFLFFYWDASF